MTECACFASALHVSDQLHRTETSLATTAFDHILSTARRASAVCRTYAACPDCPDPAYFTLYVIILRKAAACYAHLAYSPPPPHGSAALGQGASPGTASTSSSGGASSSAGGSGGGGGWYATQAATSRLRVGAFEVEAALDEQTRAIILRTEVQRAAGTAALLEAVLGPGSVKAAAAAAAGGGGAAHGGGAGGRDETALHYQRGLVATLKEEIATVDRYLQFM